MPSRGEHQSVRVTTRPGSTSSPRRPSATWRDQDRSQARLRRGIADQQALLRLQRNVGNRTVSRLVGGPGQHLAPAERVQRKFGFEIELPILFTEPTHVDVPSLADPTDRIPLDNVPQDPKIGSGTTELIDLHDAYINVDHSRTLNKLYEADLDEYAQFANLDNEEEASLKAHSRTLMPESASIPEVVTEPWDETALSPQQARAKVQHLVASANWIFDAIDGGNAALIGGYRFGTIAPNAAAFQPRLGYFHATYGVKLSQIPRLFEQTTKQKKAITKYAKKNAPEKEHAQNLQLTSRSVSAAKAAMKEIKRIWPRIAVPRKILPDTDKVAMSPASEKEFLGLITLLANYLLLIDANSGGDDLAKKLVGMHYYKSDLYDVAQQLPPDVINPLMVADQVLVYQVAERICDAAGIDYGNRMGGSLGGLTARGYILQIITGHFGVIRDDPGDPTSAAAVDAAGKTFMDPVLAESINPYSKKLGPDQLGPAGNQGMGVVLENRHLEYLNPDYGTLVEEQQQTMRDEATQYAPPKAGPDTRTAAEKAMYDSIGAREEGPARRPIGEWEDMMMAIYEMVKALNDLR